MSSDAKAEQLTNELAKEALAGLSENEARVALAPEIAPCARGRPAVMGGERPRVWLRQACAR